MTVSARIYYLHNEVDWRNVPHVKHNPMMIEKPEIMNNLYHHITGYRFIELTDLVNLRQKLYELCHHLNLKGTILLSSEGMNVNIAGMQENINSFKMNLSSFADITFIESQCATLPFRRLKVKIKKEIITFKDETFDFSKRSPSISPETLKNWLDTGKTFTLLDTRNEYEIEFGSFQNAVNPHINHFTELTKCLSSLDKKKPIVLYCTGGIRCEKGAQFFQKAGFDDVYQLERGILGYFQAVGGDHWQGSCFVFDERIAVNPNFDTIDTSTTS